MGSHNFDMRHFSSSNIKRVFSTVTSFGDKRIPDLTTMTQLVMASGAICHQWMSHELPPPGLRDSMHRYIVVGDRGILDIDGYGKLLLGKGDK